MHVKSDTSCLPALAIGALTVVVTALFGCGFARAWSASADHAFILFLAGFLLVAGRPRWLRRPERRHSLPVLSPRPR